MANSVVDIKKHELKDWTASDCYGAMLQAGVWHREHAERAETICLGHLEGTLFRCVVRDHHKDRFVWNWTCGASREDFHVSAEAARAALVEHMQLEYEQLKGGDNALASECPDGLLPRRPSRAIIIKQHRLSPAGISAPLPDEHSEPTDAELETAENVTIRTESGTIARYLILDRQGDPAFRWAWTADLFLEPNFLSLQDCRQDLIERLQLDIEASEQDRARMADLAERARAGMFAS